MVEYESVKLETKLKKKLKKFDVKLDQFILKNQTYSEKIEFLFEFYNRHKEEDNRKPIELQTLRPEMDDIKILKTIRDNWKNVDPKLAIIKQLDKKIKKLEGENEC